MNKRYAKSKSKKTIKKLSPEERQFRREQNAHKKAIRSILYNIGFSRVPDVADHTFEYDQIKTELDDAFVLDNLLLIVEYTIGKPHEHLKNKSIIYERVNSDASAFLSFLKGGSVLGLKTAIDNMLEKGYLENEIVLKIAYASKQDVGIDDKSAFERTKVAFLDYPIVQYFSVISKTIKRSCRNEFLAFLQIDPYTIGQERYRLGRRDSFTAQILPDSRSSMNRGYYVVSLYISPEELLKRAYVLRNDSWRGEENADLYQRLLEPSKIRSMRKYLAGNGYVYVNNIIVTLDTNYVTLYDKDNKQLKLDRNGLVCLDGRNSELAFIEIEDRPSIIGIIDGQHRVFSYHEGDDNEEKKISSLRKKHGLLVTGVLFPPNIRLQEKRRFEANLFLEINSKQQSPKADLKQKIAELLEPCSSTSIARKVINRLNGSGPLAGFFENHFYEQNKIKTASIISYGLKPLIKLGGSDSLFSIWNDSEKNMLLNDITDDIVLSRYIDYCSKTIREAFLSLKKVLGTDVWTTHMKDGSGILSVVFINGVLNLIRLCAESGMSCDMAFFDNAFSNLQDTSFIKEYHSSQYRKLGERLFMVCVGGKEK